jgi:hypothetical protein
MQVLLRRTEGNAELHCGVCGQGFVLFWDRQTRSERLEMLHEIQQTLRRQHRSAPGPEAHPQGGFLAPQLIGQHELSVADARAGAPTWEL